MKKDLSNLPLISEQLLFAVKTKSPATEFVNQIKNYTLSDLRNALHNDSLKKTFWINVYNAYFQLGRSNLEIPKNEIYKRKFIETKDFIFSLDDVEHGILRKYRYKYSLGLFPNLFIAKIVRNLAIDKIDYRIHFALNCGAKSCPPIAFYNNEKIDSQLNLATSSFLENESNIDEVTKQIKVSKLLLWYKFDFGGRKGINKMYLNHLNKNIKNFQLEYNDYSWDEQLNDFA